MVTQKLLLGLSQKLQDLLDESSQIFLEERLWLLNPLISQHQILDPEYKWEYKSADQLKAWRTQNDMEIDKVIKAIEDQIPDLPPPPPAQLVLDE